jgi:hypothetical protein
VGEPIRSALGRAVLLWEKPPLSCTCLTLDNGQIEICVISSGVTIERTVFQDAESAARHASDKMIAYSAF